MRHFHQEFDSGWNCGICGPRELQAEAVSEHVLISGPAAKSLTKLTADLTRRTARLGHHPRFPNILAGAEGVKHACV
jgi:hypothetical protein